MSIVCPDIDSIDCLASRAKALKTEIPDIEVVEANMDDPASMEKVMDGAYGVFGVTQFWEHGYEAEVRQGKVMVDAAKKAGVKHFVWSTFDHSDVPHFESKWEVDGNRTFLASLMSSEYLKQSGIRRTSLYTSFYFQTGK